MVYNDTTTNSGLLQDCERIIFGDYGAITDNTERKQEFTALLNQALDETATDIMTVDRNWKWDDRNHSDAPIATTDIVSGTGNYVTDVAFLRISKVEVKDASGNYRLLHDIKEQESDTIFTERFETNAQPVYYELKGANIYLYPTPNYSSTDGLKVHYQRTFDHFTTSDTTQSPGCPSVFHPLISMRASYKHAFVNQMPIARDLEKEIFKYVDTLKGQMRDRNPRGRNKLLPKYKSSK